MCRTGINLSQYTVYKHAGEFLYIFLQYYYSDAVSCCEVSNIHIHILEPHKLLPYTIVSHFGQASGDLYGVVIIQSNPCSSIFARMKSILSSSVSQKQPSTNWPLSGYYGCT